MLAGQLAPDRAARSAPVTSTVLPAIISRTSAPYSGRLVLPNNAAAMELIAETLMLISGIPPMKAESTWDAGLREGARASCDRAHRPHVNGPPCDCIRMCVPADRKPRTSGAAAPCGGASCVRSREEGNRSVTRVTMGERKTRNGLENLSRTWRRTCSSRCGARSCRGLREPRPGSDGDESAPRSDALRGLRLTCARGGSRLQASTAPRPA